MTAEEILDKWYKPKMHWNHVNKSNCVAAMTEFASQEVAALKEKCRERAIRMFTYGRNGHSIESMLAAWDKEEI